MQRVEASLSPRQRSKSVFPPRTRLHNQTPAKGEPGSDGDNDGDDGDGDGDDHNDDDDDIYIMMHVCLCVTKNDHFL